MITALLHARKTPAAAQPANLPSSPFFSFLLLRNLSHTHTHTLSLALSLIHANTHTHLHVYTLTHTQTNKHLFVVSSVGGARSIWASRWEGRERTKGKTTNQTQIGRASS